MARIAGKDVKLEISTDSGTTWKELICEITNTANFTRETTTAPLTKCDTASAAQEITPTGYSWSFDFEALTDTAPSVTQVTYQDMKTLAINGTSFLARRQYNSSGTEFYESGSVYITSLSSPAAVDGFHSFSGTMQGSGAQDITV
jgi:hypothetical protein